MKVQVRPERGKVVVSSTCAGCSNGLHDILRPCPVCKLTVAGKAALRGALYGVDRYLEALVFYGPSKPAGRP